MDSGACRSPSCTTPCRRCWRSSGGRTCGWRSFVPTPPPSKTCSWRSPDGSFVTGEARRRWRDHPLAQLTLVRYREFYREPEAIFWVFIFPILLTAGLGLAFRSQPPRQIPVALVRRGGADTEFAEALAA